MNTVNEVGQAVRDAMSKTKCSPREAAEVVLKSGKANGGFGDAFLLASILHAERVIVTSGRAQAPIAGKSRFSDPDFDVLDMEIAVPLDGTYVRKRVGDLTPEDAEALSKWYSAASETYLKRGKTWSGIAKLIPPGKTLESVWHAIPSRLQKRIGKVT